MNRLRLAIGPRTVEISRPEKILFPDIGLSKRDLAEYHQRIAAWLVPHVRDHPLTMQRFPDGIEAEGFYEKQIPDHFPDWIERVEVELKGTHERQQQVVCNDAATLVYLADQACITPHIWLSGRDRLHCPDRMIFDLDPPGKEFEIVRFAARAIRELLEELDLIAFLMTTGSRGLHVVVPLQRSARFEETGRFASDVVGVLAAREPDRLTTELRKDRRRGRLFLDHLRNAYGQTSVPPYGLRARPGAPVATPLDWEELGDGELGSQTYTVANIFRRLGQKQDPWRLFSRHARKLQSRRPALDRLLRRRG
jgi:bifunctional non-homologous end joining protein LigD